MEALNVTDMRSLMTLAQLPPNPPGRNGRPRLYSKIVLIEILRDFYARFGHQPYSSDHRRRLLPDRTTFVRAFGSMGHALDAAGFSQSEVIPVSAAKFSREALIEKLREFHQCYGRLPRYSEFSSVGFKSDILPTPKPFVRKFGSVRGAFKAAGFLED
jgi:hypothetical protein